MAAYHRGMRDADAPDYITAEEAAAILDLSTRQVNRYGKGEPARLRTRRVGRRILYARADVEAMKRSSVEAMERSSVEPPAEGVDPLTVGELISLQEAAEYAGLRSDTIHEYATNGRLAAKRLGRIWVTTRAAVDQYLASRNTKNIPRKYRKA